MDVDGGYGPRTAHGPCFLRGTDGFINKGPVSFSLIN
jgi:hypothetical protein